MKARDKNKRTMVEVTKGYDDFIKKQELKYNEGDKLFNEVIKKAATPKPKPRGSK